MSWVHQSRTAPPHLDENGPHPAGPTATKIEGGMTAKKRRQSQRMQILRKIKRKQPSTRTSQQNPAFKMQLQQEVDGVEARVGVQENRQELQRVRRFIRMMVWGLRQDRER